MTNAPIADFENLVCIARAEQANYGALADTVSAPELPSGVVKSQASAALRQLFANWGLDEKHYGTAQWNPLGTFIQSGAKVVLKPNWVMHFNRSGQGLDCLVTHTGLIEAVLEYVALANPKRVIIGDAPVQGCDFGKLLRSMGIHEMVSRLKSGGMHLSIADFRRTVLPGDALGSAKLENQRGMEHYVLFDLKQDSLLEPISADYEKFRVTMYNPELLQKTHAPGRHQYLIARELIDADVVINLPKLKSHKKACITGTLKNLVGINGHKEYLPHHRKGGQHTGGDCYAGGSRLKLWAEDLLDASNRSRAGSYQLLLSRLADLLVRVAKRTGEDTNMEGSWYGNDTVWRTVLDLQRILRYGRTDGSLGTSPQRVVLSITDAIIAGEGEGPMSPLAVPCAFVTGAVNPAAAEWINARLMGFDPKRIPLTREAFSDFAYPSAPFDPEGIRVSQGQEPLPQDKVFPFEDRAFLPPEGWQGHCELD